MSRRKPKNPNQICITLTEREFKEYSKLLTHIGCSSSTLGRAILRIGFGNVFGGKQLDSGELLKRGLFDNDNWNKWN